MNYVRLRAVFFLFLLSVAFIGCRANQDKQSGANKTDTSAAAQHVLSQFAAGEFSQIYKESAPGFKEAGSEADFVAQFQQVRKKTGELKNPKETSFEPRPDNMYVITYRMENEHVVADVHLTFVRSADGKMVLAGLHEHDEPRK